jgi:hypothetical protein
MSTFEKAKLMVDKRFQYNNKAITVIAVKDIDGVHTKVVTDKEDYTFSVGDLSRFVEKCEPLDIITKTDKEESVSVSPPDEQMAAFTNLLSEMGTVLKDDIEKIGENSDYIPQAKARGNNVNSIINLMKVGISMQKK